MSDPPPESLSSPRSRRSVRELPGGLWAMGFASLLMDASSELVHSLLPLFMVSVLGVGVAAIGVIEGVAEATAAFVKAFSGALSDRLGRRKWLMVAGYGLSALTKPVFPLAASVGWVFAGRFVDRVGKGIRGAPRDALVADIVPAPMRGAAYGLRQSLDSVGAVIGPLLALALTAWLALDIASALWVAVVPAAAAVLLLSWFVREPRPDGRDAAARPTLDRALLARLPAGYWGVVALGATFTLARFSEAFLVLRAEDSGMPVPLVPAVMVAMSLVYAIGAYPAGMLADRVPAHRLLAAGLATLVLADVVLAGAANGAAVLAGAALWGLHMGLTQGLMSKLVADAAPVDLRGTAFGVFNLVTGGATLLASVIAGALWSALGPQWTFSAGAGFAAVAMAGVLASARRRAPTPGPC